MAELMIQDLVHPMYNRSIEEWTAWRYTYAGGQNFITRYLKPFSKREGENDFKQRKDLTYNPSYAAQAVNEIKNSIFQRMPDIIRVGGPDSYQKACKGLIGGVDLFGRSMNSYMGTRVLPELLSMSRVGVFVDMPELSGITMADNIDARPYLYLYKTEDIRTWRFDQYSDQVEYSSILLRDYVEEYDEETGLPIGEIQRYRRLWVEGGKVHCQFYNEGDSPYTNESMILGQEIKEIVLDIPRIPFVTIPISQSLLQDVYKYQIALLNIESSDIAYILKSNFPFYTEQYEPRASSEFVRKAGLNEGGEAIDAIAGKPQETKVGTTSGRRYPKGLERPGFIHPSSEPLKASMEKQEQIKRSIRQLVMLAVANLEPQKMASAESKAADDKGLETGLSYIGLELENAERKIGQYWNAYYDAKSIVKLKPPEIFYPEKYELKSDEVRLDESKKLADLLEKVPSMKYKKEIAKRIADLLLRNKIDQDTYNKIMKEIEDAPATTTDPETIWGDIDRGICDLNTAEKLRGYPEGSADKAKQDHAARLARIAESQNKSPQPENNNMGSRGVGDMSSDPKVDATQEKKNSTDKTNEDTAKDRQRGKGNNVLNK